MSTNTLDKGTSPKDLECIRVRSSGGQQNEDSKEGHKIILLGMNKHVCDSLDRIIQDGTVEERTTTAGMFSFVIHNTQGQTTGVT